MPKTLKRLGIHRTVFSDDRQEDAIESLQMFRLETLIMGESPNYNWDIINEKPEIVEIKDIKLMENENQVLKVHTEFPVIFFISPPQYKYIPNSLWLFPSHSHIRIKFIEITGSSGLQIINLLMILLNIIAIASFNYQVRLGNTKHMNKFTTYVEIICNCYFILEATMCIVAQGFVLGKGTYLRNFWNVINFISIICTWGVLGKHDEPFIMALRIFRLLRVLRLQYQIPFIRHNMEGLMGSIKYLGFIIIPICFVMACYSIVGLHLFSGMTEMRCFRYIEEGFWEIDHEIENICGIWKCPHDLECMDAALDGLPRDWHASDNKHFGYNYIRFDNFYNSLLVVFTYFSMAGITETTYLFWKGINSKVAGFYFVSLTLVLGFIFRELFLASFYEGFLEHSSIIKSANKTEQENLQKEIHSQRKNQIMTRLAQINTQLNQQTSVIHKEKLTLFFDQNEVRSKILVQRTYLKYKVVSNQLADSIIFKILTTLMIVGSSIVIANDYYGIPNSLNRQMQSADFFFTLVFFVEQFIFIWAKGIKDYYKSPIHALDGLTLLSQVGLFLYCLLAGSSLIFNNNKYVCLVKALKIIRIIQLLYRSRLFYTVSVLTRCLIQTLLNIRHLLATWLLLILTVTLFGREMLSHKAKFLFVEETDSFEMTYVGNPDAVPPNSNYDSFGQALSASTLIFYNEDWHLSMYEYARATPLSFVFHILSVLLQIIIMRLITAMFLYEFTKQIRYNELELKKIDLLQFWEDYLAKYFNRIRSWSKNNCKKVHSSPPQEGGVDGSFDRNNGTQKNSQRVRQEIEQDSNDGQGLNNGIPNEKSNRKQSPALSSSARQSPGIKKQNQDGDQHPLQRVCKLIVDSRLFGYIHIIITFISLVRITLMTPLEDPNSELTHDLHICYICCSVCYSIQIILYLLAYGAISNHKSYFRVSKFNSLIFFITFIEIIDQIVGNKHPVFKLFVSFRALQLIQIASKYSKSVDYAQQALFNAFVKMAVLGLFSLAIMLVYGVFSVKLMKGEMYSCSGVAEEYHVHTKIQCMDFGGSWVNTVLNFDDIGKSIVVLFIVSTSEGWSELMLESSEAVGVGIQPHHGSNPSIHVYFIVFFFIGNLCLLNMFIGLIVETYQEAKMRAQNLHLLEETQREWFQIKISIYKMKPLIRSKYPDNLLRKALFYLVKDKRIKVCWLCCIALNDLILSIYYHRQDIHFKDSLDGINAFLVVLFSIEIICRLVAKGFKIFLRSSSNIIDLIGMCIWIPNLFIRNDSDQDFQFVRCFNAFSVAFQLTRNSRIIMRFNVIEKLFATIFSVIPNALSMLFIMLIFLFIYTTLGMDIFAYLRTQQYINGWDVHFRNFTTAAFAMMRVVSLETWFQLLMDSAHVQQPDFACRIIKTYDDFVKYGYNGCGTSNAYLYYISFHVIFSLMIMNLFIASIMIAYEDHAKETKSAISKYQLHDVVALWRKYDPDGQGFINYKDFWRLSSQIAIIFGVDQKDLLDKRNKNTFLKVLNIPIYECKKDGIFCYKFHDVIISLTRISVVMKFGVGKQIKNYIFNSLEPTDKEIVKNLQETISGFHKRDDRQFIPSNLMSGDMGSIIYIQARFRSIRSRKQNGVGDFGEFKKNSLIQQPEEYHQLIAK